MTHLCLAMMTCERDVGQLSRISEELKGRPDSVVLLVDSRTKSDVDGIARSLWSVPVRVEWVTWVNFAYGRNALWTLASEPIGNAPHQVLLIDPDVELEGTIPLDLPAPVYNVTWRRGGLKWQVPSIIRCDVNAKWIGVTHEYCEIDVPAVHLTDIIITEEWIEKPGRFEDDLLLLEGHRDEPRAAFYYAQTLKDLGRFAEAFEAYMKRAQMTNGFDQEMWYAVYEAACLVAALDEELAEVLWRRCIRLRPHRCEPYWQLARQANSRERFVEGEKWAEDGLSLGPSQDTLFINRWMEEVGLREQFDIAKNGQNREVA